LVPSTAFSKRAAVLPKEILSLLKSAALGTGC